MTLPLALIELYQSIRTELGWVERDLEETLHSDRPEVRAMTAVAAGYGGKRMRPAMVLLVGRAAGGITPRHARLGAAIEMIHLATLVHDDVIDDASLRRKQETVNRHWSNWDAVLLGDVLFTRSMHLLARLDDQRSLLRVTGSVSTLCEGEILQNRNRRRFDLDEATYYDIIQAKTAELYEAGCELGAHLAGANDDTVRAFAKMGRELGIAFQIVDDCLDLAGDEGEVGKSLGTDLSSGKMTMPLIALREALERAKDDAALTTFRSAIEARATPELARKVQLLLREHGAMDAAIARAREHVALGLDAVRPFVAKAHEAWLEAIGEYILERVS